MFRHGLLDDLIMHFQQSQHAGFAGPHLPTEAYDVGEHDRGELAGFSQCCFALSGVHGMMILSVPQGYDQRLGIILPSAVVCVVGRPLTPLLSAVAADTGRDEDFIAESTQRVFYMRLVLLRT